MVDIGRSPEYLLSMNILKSFPLLVSLALVVSASGSTGDPKAGDHMKIYDQTGFTGLEVRKGMRLELRQADSYSVRIRTWDFCYRFISLKRDGSRLTITRSLTFFPVTIEITAPKITNLVLSGGSRGEFGLDLPEESVTLVLSGGSRLSGSLNARTLRLEHSGGSRTELTGRADSIKAEASGGSRISMESFPVRDAVVGLSGGSSARLSVSGTLSAEASGGSRLSYHGKPRMGKTAISGGSEIKSIGQE